MRLPDGPNELTIALEACKVMRLPRKQENSVQLRARASLVAEQTGPRLLSGPIRVQVPARASHLGALVHAVRRESLKLQNGVQIPGASCLTPPDPLFHE